MPHEGTHSRHTNNRTAICWYYPCKFCYALPEHILWDRNFSRSSSSSSSSYNDPLLAINAWLLLRPTVNPWQSPNLWTQLLVSDIRKRGAVWFSTPSTLEADVWHQFHGWPYRQGVSSRLGASALTMKALLGLEKVLYKSLLLFCIATSPRRRDIYSIMLLYSLLIWVTICVVTVQAYG